MTSSFELKNVGIIYPASNTGIKIDKLDIPDNGITAIIGASGSGKSTLLNLLAGFSAPSPEFVEKIASILKYTDPNGTSFDLLHEKQVIPDGKLGFIFQDAYLLKSVPIALNIGVGMLGAGHRITSEKINLLLKKVGLSEDYALRRGRRLSGGEAQRIAFCRAFGCDPHVILADEPTSNLDAALAEKLMQLLKEWVNEKDKQRVIIWITHDIRLAAQFANHVVVLAHGRLSNANTWPQPLTAKIEDNWHNLNKWIAETAKKNNGNNQPTTTKSDSEPTNLFHKLGFITRLAVSEMFGHPRIDIHGPAAVISPWSAYIKKYNISKILNLNLSKKPFQAFSHGNLAFVTFLCLLIVYFGLESHKAINYYFDTQMARPEIRHVWVEYERSTSISHRDIVFTDRTLKKLEEDLIQAIGKKKNDAFPIQIFGRRYRPMARFAPMPQNADCSKIGGSSDGMLVVNLQEPLFLAASAYSIADWQSKNIPNQSLGQILQAAQFNPEQDVVVTKDFYENRLGAKDSTDPITSFCLLEHIPRPLRIVAIVDRLPGTDQFKFAYLIDEKNFSLGFKQNPPLGTNGALSPYSIAAIYFHPPTFNIIREQLKKAEIPMRKDSFDALSALLNLSSTSKSLLSGIISLILLLAAIALSLIAQGYIKENERAFFVMRAFGHRRWMLFMLLILQMAGVTSLMLLVTAFMLYTFSPVFVPSIATAFELPAIQLAFSFSKLAVPVLVVFGIQVAVSGWTIRSWWKNNRFIAERMQVI